MTARKSSKPNQRWADHPATKALRRFVQRERLWYRKQDKPGADPMWVGKSAQAAYAFLMVLREMRYVNHHLGRRKP